MSDFDDECTHWAYGVCTCQRMCPDDRRCRSCFGPLADGETQCEKCRDAR